MATYVNTITIAYGLRSQRNAVRSRLLALVLYFAGAHENVLGAGFALACLILGFVVSYSKARAEGLGMTANVGIRRG